ncbi:MAG TPA: hypothetical protein VMX56_09045 [Anaerolineales bacterium]|nr:hypothetical protein [Anaerolineales bacterium]
MEKEPPPDLPWFKTHAVNDVLMATMGWDDELSGIYLKLAALQWHNHHAWKDASLEKIRKELCKFCPSADKRWDDLLAVVPDGKLPRIAELREKEERLYHAKSQGGRTRAAQMKLEAAERLRESQNNGESHGGPETDQPG